MRAQGFCMGLDSFSVQFHSFFESQSIEESPSLEKAIKQAEEIIAKSNAEQMVSRQSIQAMGKVSACFKNFPEIRKGIQDIIRSEIKKIEDLGGQVLLKKRPAEEAAPEEPTAKKRKQEQPETTTEMEVEEAEEEAVSRKRVREGEIEGAPSAKIAIEDPWVEYKSTNLLIKVFNQKITFDSPDQLSRVISEQVDQVLSEFETEAKDNPEIRPKQIAAVKKLVQERIKSDMDRLSQVDPALVGKLGKEIKTIANAFSFITFPKGFEQYDEELRFGCIGFIKEFNSEVIDINSLFQKLSEFPAEIRADLLEQFCHILGLTSIKKEEGFVLGREEQREKLTKAKAHEPAIVKFEKELRDKKIEFEKERGLVLKDLFRTAPFLADSEWWKKANLNCLKLLLTEMRAGKLSFLPTEPRVWTLLLNQLNQTNTLHIPHPSKMLDLLAQDLNTFLHELKEKWNLSEETAAILGLDLFENNFDLQHALHVLPSTTKEDQEYLQELLQEHPVPIIKFLMEGGSLTLFRDLKTHGIFWKPPWYDIQWTKETIAQLKSFSESDWETLKLLCKKFDDINFNDLVPQDQITKDFFTRLSKVARWVSFTSVQQVVECLHKPQLVPGDLYSYDYSTLKDALTPLQRYTLASAVSELQDTPIFWYLAEDVGSEFFFDKISSSFLSTVPTGPLIRALASKPFPQIKSWLEEYISPQLEIQRMHTLTPDQKYEILRAFPRYGSPLPTQGWLDLFGVSQEQAQVICAPGPDWQGNPNLEYQQRKLSKLDPQDPDDLLINCLGDTVKILMDLSKTHSICGEAKVMTWGPCSELSLCSDRNSVPLVIRHKPEGEAHTIYSQGVTSDFDFPVAAVRILRKYIELKGEPIGKDTELNFEIVRIAIHLREIHPSVFFEKKERDKPFPPQECDPATLPEQISEIHSTLYNMHKESKTVLELLKGSYHDFVKAAEAKKLLKGSHYNRDHSGHRTVFSLITLFLMTRLADSSPEGTLTEIFLSDFIHLKLKSLAREEYEVKLEDNPCVWDEDKEAQARKFEEFQHSIAWHTLSALTPDPSFPPSKFLKLMKELQKLSQQQFYSIIASALELVTNSEDTFDPVSDIFDKWQKSWPEGITLSGDAKSILFKLVNNYITLVDKYSAQLEPNAKILFDPLGVDTYGPKSAVPPFVRGEGNYASALGTEFTFHNPVLHEGNCGVNALQSALNGPGAYTGEGEKSKAEVQTDQFRKKAVDFVTANRAFLSGIYGPGPVEEFIVKYNDPTQAEWTSPLVWHCKARFDASAFRAEIVNYATIPIHKLELSQKYGDEYVDSFIRTYNNQTQSEYSDPIVWECAANVYGHTINLYSRAEATSFELDAQDKVKPSGVFSPQGKEPLLPPLNIMLFGPHYVCLIPKD